VTLLLFQNQNFSPPATQIMAGRGGRGAILDALLAHQQRREKVGVQADESQVGKYINNMSTV
jgi:hypothetical protein